MAYHQALVSYVIGHACGVGYGLQGFDEVRRLGLRQETEVVVRAAKARSHGAPGGCQQ
jgi:hypothetical protein